MSNTSEFVKDLEGLINKFSLENESNTPDFILAQFLKSCLSAFNEATKERTDWFETYPILLNKNTKQCH